MENEIKNNEIEIIDVPSVTVTEAQSRAEIDIQIATANRFPRNIDRAVQNLIAFVSKDKELAKTCVYSLPRAGKSIEGESVHLARLMMSEYCNMRVDAKIVDIGMTMITAQATAHDVQKNIAARTEVKRRITDKRGQRFNEDMIVMTCNAALAIATRNAIFQVIPMTVRKNVYEAAKKAIIGDLTSEQKLITRRNELLEGFAKTYGVTEVEILSLLSIETINQIREEQILTLTGLAQAIRDGDTSVADAFGRTVEKKAANETKQKVDEAIKKAKEKRAAKQMPKVSAQQKPQQESASPSENMSPDNVPGSNSELLNL